MFNSFWNNECLVLKNSPCKHIIDVWRVCIIYYRIIVFIVYTYLFDDRSIFILFECTYADLVFTILSFAVFSVKFDRLRLNINYVVLKRIIRAFVLDILVHILYLIYIRVYYYAQLYHSLCTEMCRVF